MNLEQILPSRDRRPDRPPAGVNNMATLPPPQTLFYGPPGGVKLPAEFEGMIGVLERLQGEQASLQAEWSKLRDERQAVELRDRQALGSAIAQARLDPQPELPAHDAEMDRVQERITGLDYAIGERVRRLHDLTAEHRDEWLADAEHAIGEWQTEVDEAVPTARGCPRRARPSRTLRPVGGHVSRTGV